jgi:hypothetical protein
MFELCYTRHHIEKRGVWVRWRVHKLRRRGEREIIQNRFGFGVFKYARREVEGGGVTRATVLEQA